MSAGSCTPSQSSRSTSAGGGEAAHVPGGSYDSGVGQVAPSCEKQGRVIQGDDTWRIMPLPGGCRRVSGGWCLLDVLLLDVVLPHGAQLVAEARNAEPRNVPGD